MLSLLKLMFLYQNAVHSQPSLDGEFTKKENGYLYPKSSTIDDLNSNGFNCIYYNKGYKGSMRYIKCHEGSHCVAVASVVYVHHQWNVVVDYQDCYPTFFETMKYENCSSPSCNLGDMEQRNNKSMSLKYCCCTGSLCNINVIFSSVTNFEEEWHVSAGNKRKSMEEHSSDLLWLIAVSVATSILLMLFLLGLYVWKKKKFKNLNKHKEVLDSSHNIHIVENIIYGNVLHEGLHSIVRLCTFDNKTFAVKVFPSNSKTQYHNEKEIYNILGQHSNIAEFITYGHIHRDGNFEGLILMNHYVHGSLVNYIGKYTLGWKEFIKLACSISTGLAYLHGESDNTMDRLTIVHRDLNSRNILVKSDGTCVLADFGFALCVSKSPPESNFSVVGSARYMAPEVLSGIFCYTEWVASLKNIDSYALGLVLWELVRRCHDIYEAGHKVPKSMLPYEEELGFNPDIKTVKYNICDLMLRPTFPDGLMENNFALEILKETIAECWDADSGTRLSPLCVFNRLQQIQNLAMTGPNVYIEPVRNNEETEPLLVTEQGH